MKNRVLNRNQIKHYLVSILSLFFVATAIAVSVESYVRFYPVRQVVSSSWKIESGRFILDLNIPVGSTATVVMPSDKRVTDETKDIEKLEDHIYKLQ
jgi:hypothetical protein